MKPEIRAKYNAIETFFGDCSRTSILRKARFIVMCNQQKAGWLFNSPAYMINDNKLTVKAFILYVRKNMPKSDRINLP